MTTTPASHPNVRFSLSPIAPGCAVAELTIDRPDKRNALTPEMLETLITLAAAAPDHARSLVLAGAGAAFCSGFDLTLCVAEPDGAVMRSLLSGLSRLVRTLRGLPIPVVAAAHGAALAGGCALLGGADVIVTDQAAKFGYPVVRIGVSPAVSAPFLFGMVHPGPARVRQLDPGLVTGAQACRLGLAHECLESPDQVLPKARTIAAELAIKPTLAMQTTKAWLLSLDEAAAHAAAGLDASLALTGGPEERALLSRAFATPPAKPA
jgi:methylglutaconyl-CoA hydratase